MRIFLFVLFLLLLVGGVWFFIFSSKQPSLLSENEKNAAMQKLLGRKPVLQEKTTQNTWISHKSNYESFLYPERARVYANDNKIAMQEKTVLDNFFFGVASPKLDVSVQVIQYPNMQNISDDPSVRLREEQQDTYAQSSLSIDTLPAETFFTTKNSIEASAFFLAHEHAYSIVVTGVSREDVETFFTAITQSFHVL